MTTTDTDRMPAWVHMAEVPPTDEEPWTPDDDAPTGGALAWTILAIVFVLGVLVGRASA